jgi:integrase
MGWTERRSGGWRACWREGTRRCSSVAFPSQALAKAELRQRETILAAQSPVSRSALIPWAELVQRFMASRSGTTEGHQKQARTMLGRLAITHGWQSAADPTVAQLRALKAGEYRHVRALLREAAILGQPVAPGLLILRRRRERAHSAPAMLTDARVAAIVAKAYRWSRDDGLLLDLVATYGHRLSSLLPLKVRDLDAVAGTLTMHVKSGDVVRRPILPATAAALAKHCKKKKPDDLIFSSHLGRPWRCGNEFSSWVQHSVSGSKATGAGEGVVALRKYATTRLYRACGDAKTVAEIQGRRTPSLVLTIYAQTDDAAMRGALAALPPIANGNPKTAH